MKRAKQCHNQFGLFCPKCGDSDQLDITATVVVRLTPDGTDADESEDGSHTWGDNSRIDCIACGWSGAVWRASQAKGKERRRIVKHLIDHLARWTTPYSLEGVWHGDEMVFGTGSTSKAMEQVFAGDRNSAQLRFKFRNEDAHPTLALKVDLDLRATGKEFVSEWSGRGTNLGYEFDKAILAFDPDNPINQGDNA